MGTCLTAGFSEEEDTGPGINSAGMGQTFEQDLEALDRRCGNAVKALLGRCVEDIEAAQDTNAVRVVLRDRRPLVLRHRGGHSVPWVLMFRREH